MLDKIDQVPDYFVYIHLTLFSRKCLHLGHSITTILNELLYLYPLLYI